MFFVLQLNTPYKNSMRINYMYVWMNWLLENIPQSSMVQANI